MIYISSPSKKASNTAAVEFLRSIDKDFGIIFTQSQLQPFDVNINIEMSTLAFVILYLQYLGAW